GGEEHGAERHPQLPRPAGADAGTRQAGAAAPRRVKRPPGIVVGQVANLPFPLASWQLAPQQQRQHSRVPASGRAHAGGTGPRPRVGVANAPFPLHGSSMANVSLKRLVQLARPTVAARTTTCAGLRLFVSVRTTSASAFPLTVHCSVKRRTAFSRS